MLPEELVHGHIVSSTGGIYLWISKWKTQIYDLNFLFVMKIGEYLSHDVIGSTYHLTYFLEFSNVFYLSFL